MLNYEEYFLHEQNGDFKYDYQVMAEMLLNKNVDEKYWIQISAFELMDYMYVLCAFYEESMAEEFKSKEYKMKIHMRVTDDLKRCYQTFLERFQDNSDVIAVFGHLIEIYEFIFMMTEALETWYADTDNLTQLGEDLLLKASKMGNPFGISIVELNRRVLTKEEQKKIDEDAILYIKNVFPKGGFTQQQLLYTLH